MRQLQSLRRKYALPLAALKLRRLAEQFCAQWHTPAANNRPAPESQPFIKRIADSGFPLNTFTSLHKSLTRHHDNKTTPKPIEIVQDLLPQAITNGTLPACFTGELPPAATRPLIPLIRIAQDSRNHQNHPANPLIPKILIHTMDRTQPVHQPKMGENRGN